MDEPEAKPPSPRHLSKTPSWILLGFVLGVLFVWSLPSREPIPSAPVAAQKPVTPDPLPVRPLDEIEAVFTVWAEHAVWAHDLTEVSLWDPLTGQFSRHYEVLRNGPEYFFRSIPQLTRPILTHGVPEETPLRFTETEARREQFLSARRQAQWETVRETIPGATKRSTP
jgi:hypothetical protein